MVSSGLYLSWTMILSDDRSPFAGVDLRFGITAY